MSAETELDEIAARLRKLADVGSTRAADIAASLEARVRRTAEAGQSPDGAQWEATKKGTAPLQHVGDVIRSTHNRVGNVTHVAVKLRGHHVLHDAGLANGAPRRQVLPDQIDDAAIAEVLDILDQEIEAALR